MIHFITFVRLAFGPGAAKESKLMSRDYMLRLYAYDSPARVGFDSQICHIGPIKPFETLTFGKHFTNTIFKFNLLFIHKSKAFP